MGTRADFYLGRDEPIWLGSVAWDGYPDGFDPKLVGAKSEGQYLDELRKEFGGRDDVTLPEDGWPWPWDNSGTTDFAYFYQDGAVYITNYGSGYYLLDDWNDGFEKPTQDFPDMSDIKNVTLAPRSGLIVVEKS